MIRVDNPAKDNPLRMSLTFGSGLVESSGSFIVIYRNQFGVMCMAYQEPGEEMVDYLAPEAQAAWGSVDPAWPNGRASGTWDPDISDLLE